MLLLKLCVIAGSKALGSIYPLERWHSRCDADNYERMRGRELFIYGASGFFFRKIKSFVGSGIYVSR